MSEPIAGDEDPADRPVGAESTDEPRLRAEFGDAWVYESIVGAVPGAALSTPVAIGLQVAVFEVGILVLAAAYGLWDAVLPGTVAVGVAAVGSLFMLTLGDENRTLAVSPTYYRLLFGSSIEVVLSVLAFAGVITYLFVVDPATVGPPAVLAPLLPVAVAPATEPIVTDLFGERPPAPAVFLALVVVWDLCYRIGTSWWTAVVSLYREVRLECGPGTRRRFRRLDALNVGFALVQLALVPFVVDRPVLLAAVLGHVVAVTVVSAAAIALSLAAQ